MEKVAAATEAMSVSDVAGFLVLSKDLVCNILARLPPPSLAISRCVCSTWNQIVISQPPNQVPRPWCFLLSGLMLYEVPETFGRICAMKPYAYTSASCWVYSPGDNKWFGLPALEPEVPDAGFFNEYVTTSGSAGLVAFQPGGDENICTDFWVGNPLTNKWRVIPWPIPREEEEDDDDDEEEDDKGHVTQLALDESSKSYKIVVFLVKRAVQLYPPPDVFWATHVYDSSSRTWTARATMSQRRPVTNGSCHLEGVVYLLQWYDQRKTQLQVLAYNIDRNEFSVAIPGAPFHCPGFGERLEAVFHMTVKKDSSGGGELRLEFLGALSHAHAGLCVESMCVFKYDAAAASWVADKQSKTRVRDFYSKSLLSTDVYLHSCGQCGTAFVSPHYSKDSGGLLAYNCAKAEGTYMVHPGYSAHPLSRETDTTTLTSSIGSFIPRLDVEP